MQQPVDMHGLRARITTMTADATARHRGTASSMWRAETRTWKTRTLAQPSLAVLDFAHDKAGRCFIDGLSAYLGLGACWGWLGPNGHRVLLPARLKR